MQFQIPAVAFAAASQFVAQPNTAEYEVLSNVAFYYNKYGRPEIAAGDGHSMIMLSWDVSLAEEARGEIFALHPMLLPKMKKPDLSAQVCFSLEYVTPDGYHGGNPRKAYHVVCEPAGIRPSIRTTYTVIRNDFGVLPGIVAQDSFYLSWYERIKYPNRFPPEKNKGKIFGCSYMFSFAHMEKFFLPGFGTPTFKASGGYVAVHYPIVSLPGNVTLTACGIIMSYTSALNDITDFKNAL